MEEHLAQRADLEGRLRELERLIEAETQALAQKKAEAERMTAQCAELNEQLGTAKERRSALHSRRELLGDLERRMEGVGAAARTLLEAKRYTDDAAAFADVCGLVGDLFTTDFEHAPVIEAALGEADQVLVLARAAAVPERPELFGDLPSRLATIALDRLPVLVNERSYSGQVGFVARALDLVRCDARYAALARLLLAKTVIVEDLGTALRFAGEGRAWPSVCDAGRRGGGAGRSRAVGPGANAGGFDLAEERATRHSWRSGGY